MDDALSDDKEIERTSLASMLISPLVLEEIHLNHFASDSVGEHLLFVEWMKWYTVAYKKGDSTPFRTMAEASLKTIKWAIAQVNYHARR